MVKLGLGLLMCERERDPELETVPTRTSAPQGIVTVTTVGLKRPGPVGIHTAATEPCHCAAASALKIRSVDREMRWR